jgi:diaminohydroxyphosphoribosylaminopyrimidine deaminase/5-amino-6-(5-phosphoribosylamino)uracil reductase
MVIDDAFYLNLAINEAWRYQLLTYPNPAVGALILDEHGAIIALEAHKKHGQAHAELEACKVAFASLSKDNTPLSLEATDAYNYLLENHNNLFQNATIYVTLEPCNHHGSTPPCALLIENLGFRRVVIGVLDSNQVATGGYERLKKNAIVLNSKEAQALLEPFRKWQEDRFVFFKVAQRLNGSVDGGIISSEASRTMVHHLRDKIDLLVIGGQSVRTDRPTLDARMVNGKAPDVLIYSKQKVFDKSIPLFSVPDRQVFISDSLERLKEYNFIMIEGGAGLFEALKECIDWTLDFIAPTMQEGKSFKSSAQFDFLHSEKIDKDYVIWMRNG